MNKKNIIRILVALCVAGVAYFVVSRLTAPKLDSGMKEVSVKFEVEDADGNKTAFYEQSVRTNAETVGDLLEELNETPSITITLSGEKSDPYGRTLVGVKEYVTEDWNGGPWWLYNSTTNKDCVDAGFCNGIDANPVYDKDIFVFTFTSTY